MSKAELNEADLEQTTAGKSTWASSESGALLIRALTTRNSISQPTIGEKGRAIREDREAGRRLFS